MGHFSALTPGKELPEAWEPMTFSDIDRHTRYTLIRDDVKTVILAGGCRQYYRPYVSTGQ